jgi:SAM-dependent methyltransferase
MNWTELDWPALDRLRDGFLRASQSDGPYWESESALASYDLTYGERIGWKWDQVLRELQLRQWRPKSRSLVDWGCGSGIAARRVAAFFGAGHFDELTVWDHSPLACTYATDVATREFPHLRVNQATPGFLRSEEPIGLLLISHVLNELPVPTLADLKSLVRRAQSVIWVEPGTSAVSRQLGGLHDELRGSFRLVAPCTHQNSCPVFVPGNEREWCHFFAPPPSEIFANPDWVKFGQRAGIDLRSLPYCFFALDRSETTARENGAADKSASNDRPGRTIGEEELSHIIGRPEHFKPYARLLNCDSTGLAELTLPKRADPALYKQLDRTKAPLVYRWRREGLQILGGTPLSPIHAVDS